MPDISLLWGNDIDLSPSGDLATVDGPQLTIQRIIRRLMTRGDQVASLNQRKIVGEYVYHMTYGGSVPSRIGDATNLPLLQAMVLSQISKESTVAKSPTPQITLTTSLDSVTVSITYWDAVTGAQKSLSFDVNN